MRKKRSLRWLVIDYLAHNCMLHFHNVVSLLLSHCMLLILTHAVSVTIPLKTIGWGCEEGEAGGSVARNTL